MKSPDDLINLFCDLESRLTQFRFNCEEIAGTANRQQMLFTDALHSNKQLFYRLSDDVDEVCDKNQLLINKTGQLSSSSLDMRENIDEVKSAAAETCQHMCQLLQTWQQEVSKAKVWVEKAEVNLRETEVYYKRMVLELDRCRSALESARHDYQSCIDMARATKQPAQCGLYHARVREREAALDVQQAVMIQAKLKLKSCQVDLNNAENRLRVCLINEGIATKSKLAAVEAVSRVEEAESYMCQTEVSVEGTKKKMAEISMCIGVKKGCLEQVDESLGHSEAKNNSAQEVNSRSLHHAEEYESLATPAKSKLDNYIDFLERFDHVGNMI